MRDPLSYLERLQGVDLSLCRAVYVGATRFAQNTGFRVNVVSGLRTAEEQLALFMKGASKTTKSRHMVGEAVDLAVIDGNEFRTDRKPYESLNGMIQAAAKQEGVWVLWGGIWRLRDYMHWQLSSEEEIRIATEATTPAKDGGARKPALRLLDKPQP